jgi:hypothetical protein
MQRSNAGKAFRDIGKRENGGNFGHGSP